MKKYTFQEFIKYRDECIQLLSENKLPINQEILPEYLCNGYVAYHCFKEDKVELSYDECVSYKQTEIIERMFSRQVKILDATKLGHGQLVYLALKNHNYYGADLNKAILLWNTDKSDYFEILNMLIDYGATIDTNVKDFNKFFTNWLYHINSFQIN